MEITALKSPPTPGGYYRLQAARVRRLAQEATMPALREHLADVARQYEKLAEEAEAAAMIPNRVGYRPHGNGFEFTSSR